MKQMSKDKWQRIAVSIGIGVAFGIPMMFLYDNWLGQLSGFIGAAASMATSMYIVLSPHAPKKKRED